jgi:HSP20 family protein
MENRLLDLRTEMDRLFDEFYGDEFSLGPLFKGIEGLGDFAPKMDIDETEKEITVSAELPGLKPEDVDISLDDNILTIQGEKKEEKEEKDKHSYHMERSFGSFARSVRLPSEVDTGKIDASLKDGLLKITLPKSQEAQEESRKIPIKSN